MKFNCTIRYIVLITSFLVCVHYFDAQNITVQKQRLDLSIDAFSVPKVSADGSLLAISYTEGAHTDIAIFQKDEVLGWKRIEVSNIINTSNNEQLEFLSNDGASLIFSRPESDRLHFYLTRRVGSIWTSPQDTNIFPQYSDMVIHSFVFSNDFQQAFVSVKKHPKEDFDLYSSYKLETGNWSALVPMGEKINSNGDEILPSIHPSGNKLYFSSNRLGNYDIYASEKMNKIWESASSFLAPLNTKDKDEKGITMTANGKLGYLLSISKEEKSINKVLFPSENIPLTLIKGKVISTDGKIPTGIRIKVYDRETNEELKYVYSPQASTGKYLMIFPPGKNYDMIVEAKGYEPYKLNIFIPNQAFYYQLQQTVILNPMKEQEEGAGIEVKNNFDQDVYSNDSREKNLLDLIEKIIEEKDTLALKNLDQYLDQGKAQDTVKRYASLLSLIEKVIESGDLEMLENLELIAGSEVSVKADLILYFSNNSSVINEDDRIKIQNLCGQIKDNAKIKIRGHSDGAGSSLSKYLISNLRANAVSEYIQKKCGVSKSQITILSLGDSQPLVANDNGESSRRVEVEITK